MASIIPVLVGTAAVGFLDVSRFLAALVVAVALQVGVNFANDYFDAVKGVDTQLRIGPRRMTSSGMIAPGQMRIGIIVALAVAIVAGGYLAFVVGPELLIVGVVAIAATLAYSGGPRPYASMALGEFAVFLFFGLVATVGSAYVQTNSFSLVALTAAVPIGLLATAILVVNNLRDIPTDRLAGKTTLAVRLGDLATRRLYRRLVFGAAASLAFVHLSSGSLWVLLSLVAGGIAARALTKIAFAEGDELISVLVLTARLQMVFGVSLAAALLLAL